MLLNAPEQKAKEKYDKRKAEGENWAQAHRNYLEAALANTRYERHRFEVVEGDILETIPEHSPDQIALLHLDTDWYDSTKHELEHLYPRLVPGGVLVVDDYGRWAGSRRAVDEYLSGQSLFLMGDSHYHAVVAVKPPRDAN